MYTLLPLDLLTKSPTEKFFNYANARNSIKFLRHNEELHGTPWAIRVDQASCFNDSNLRTLRKPKHLIVVPANVHRSIGLSEQLVKTVKADWVVRRENGMNRSSWTMRFANQWERSGLRSNELPELRHSRLFSDVYRALHYQVLALKLTGLIKII